MKINLDSIKSINLCYENCEVDTVFRGNIHGINIQRKTLSKTLSKYRKQPSFNIKTFEIALIDDNNVLKDTDIILRRDLAQLTINYLDNTYDHFFITWGKNDCTYDISSLQKVHKKDNMMILTSNCELTY